MRDIRSYITLQNFAAFALVLFCIQYIPVESRAGVSYLKLVVSLLCPFVLVSKTLKISRAMLLIILYSLFVFIASIMHPATLRWSTVLFLGSFLWMYVTFYNLVVAENVFSEDFFIRLLKALLMAYSITLVVQQMFILAGIREFPLINLTQYLNRGIGANALSYEPSSAARIMCVAFLGLIRMIELRYGRPVTMREIVWEAKWPTIGFLWSMLTMGSGTAIIGLGILALYFFNPNTSLIAIAVVMVSYFTIPYIDYFPVQRAYRVFNAVMTGAQDTIISTDVSAATRITPVMNIFTKLDLTQLETWFGHGVDHMERLGDYKVYMREGMVGGVQNYGLLSFLIMQAIIYTCVIRKFFSIESLMWFFLFGMSFANVPYTWGAMMIFTTVRYFQTKDFTYE